LFGVGVKRKEWSLKSIGHGKPVLKHAKFDCKCWQRYTKRSHTSEGIWVHAEKSE